MTRTSPSVRSAQSVSAVRAKTCAIPVNLHAVPSQAPPTTAVTRRPRSPSASGRAIARPPSFPGVLRGGLPGPESRAESLDVLPVGSGEQRDRGAGHPGGQRLEALDAVAGTRVGREILERRPGLLVPLHQLLEEPDQSRRIDA